MWPFDGIKVGNTSTTGGHLVVFTNSGGHLGSGHLVVYTVSVILIVIQVWKTWTYFRKWSPIKIPRWPQLPLMSKNQHGPS